MTLSILKSLKKIQREIKTAVKDGDTAAALAAQKRLNEIIKGGVNSPLMPRAAPLSEAQIQAYAERMAPQIAGELTRKEKSADTLAGKSQKQFKREQTLPVDRKVLPGAVDPSAPLPSMTLEDKIGSVLLGLPGDPTLARVSLSGIGDVPFERAVTQHGGPRYGDENKLWASNLSAATGLLNAADRASRQFGDAPVVASYMKMPSGFGFAQHYLESLLQYQRPDLMNKAAKEALEKDIKAGFVDSDGKRVTFPNFPGFDDLGAVAQAAESNSILRKHIAAKLGTSEKYGLRPAADVQFAVSHPELTNLETGASGFTLGELTPSPLTESAHPSYSYDIPGKVIGQLPHATPYDLLYRDQLELIRQNPKSPEFNTLKLLGARQQIDEQLVNEINEYQERVRRLIGKKDGGLAMRETEEGLAPHGMRHSGEGVKGSGYFGYLPASDGYATEMSAENEGGEFPLLVPTLSKEEIEHLLAGNSPTDEIFRKAVEHAERRKKEGKSPYADPTGLKHPVPKAEGGTVNYELPDDVTPQNWRDQLETNVLNDARALIGVKEGGPINLDRLLEKAVRKANGGPANLDDMLKWAVAKHNHKMKKGGEVSQTFPLKKDEEEERMFSPAPLKIPEPITDALEALKRQFEKEKRSMSKPGAVQDVLMRGPVAMYAGAPADIVGMGGEALDWLQTKIPGMRKPASVMDTGPEKVPPMGYAPAFPLTPNEPYGTEAAQELMKQSGLTTGTERPLFEITSGVAAPFAGMAALKTGKALAPTATDMMDAQLQQMMRLGKAGERVASQAIPSIMERGGLGADLLSAMSRGTTSNVIKPEGGNWIQGAAEKYLKDLRYDESLIDPVGVMNPTAKAEETARVAAMNNFVDKKLSRYLVNQMGTPSDTLRLQADAWADTQKKLLADKDKQIDKVRSDIQKAQRERGVDPEVLTRSQARLRELQKERELINNRKGLHFDPGHDDFRQRIGRDARSRAEMPQENLGVTEVAKNWEDLSDSAIRQGAYKDMIPIVENSVSAQLSTNTPEEYAKVFNQLQRESLRRVGGEFAVENPEALAYGMNSGRPARDLRFDHMMDEIDNALRPSQGLPDYLQLKPKDLDKMSVAQVSEHVDKINAWRASQKAEVDAARAANAATVEHKAYDVVPGTDIPNDQGLRWVEIKVPEMVEDFKVPDRYEIRKPTPSSETFAIWDKEANQYITTGIKTEEAAIKHLHDTINKSAVEDALKYEGEILQHCVGGYCPDVIEGRSRIFSLRDADGRPHATIEVEPDSRVGFRAGEAPLGDDFYVQQNRYIAGQNDGSIPNDVTFAEWWRSQNGIEEPRRSERISQIKGLLNRKPNDEYMPFIQDFVRSGQWSHVKDLENSDLRKVAPDSALAKKMKAAGVEPPLYVSNDELSQLLKQYKEGLYSWKRGGRVTKADLEQQFRMAFGGGVFNTDPDITDSGRIIPEHTI